MTEIIERGDFQALRSPKDIPPPSFSDEKSGPYMITELSKRKLWQNRPQAENGKPDTALFVNLQQDRSYVFDTRNFKTGDTYSPKAIPRDGFSAIVVVSGAMYGDDENIRGKITETLTALKPGGSLFLFEEWGTNTDKIWREEVLEKAGLVERNVLTSGKKVKGSTLWEAHMPREGLKHPINLLEEGPPWIKAILREMEESYRNEGYTIEDSSKLIAKLRKSKFPLKDIYLIRDRAGVVIRSQLCPTATCVFEVDTSGNRYALNSCREEHELSDNGKNKELNEPNETGREEQKRVDAAKKPPVYPFGELFEISTRTCGECGRCLHGIIFNDGKKNMIEVRCTSDGLVGVYPPGQYLGSFKLDFGNSQKR